MLLRKQRKVSKKKRHVKGIRILLRKKKNKRQHACEQKRNLFEEEKNKSISMVVIDVKTFLSMKNKC